MAAWVPLVTPRSLSIWTNQVRKLVAIVEFASNKHLIMGTTIDRVVKQFDQQHPVHLPLVNHGKHPNLVVVVMARTITVSDVIKTSLATQNDRPQNNKNTLFFPAAVAKTVNSVELGKELATRNVNIANDLM